MSVKSLIQKVDTNKKSEIKLSVYVACHSSIQSVDHLSELWNDLPCTSSTEKLRLHRTKCSALIKKVISPALLAEQVSDLKNSPFSLILDESTDIACAKHLCVCVRYYNVRLNKVVSQFLGLIPVTSATAEAIYQHVKDYFNEIGVNLNHCFAIGTDGASNLCGQHHSFYTLLKKDISDLVLVKCVCHSLHLVCSHASEKMPSNIDYMLRETYNWFHRSAIRREAYLDIYKLLNDGNEPLQLVPLSGTRWLARSNSVKRVLDQWDVLKTHFEIASSSCDKYLARELHSMYADHSNELYFTFLKPVLSQFEKINLLFQKEAADLCSLLNELENLTFSVLRRIIYPTSVKLDVDMNFKSIFLPLEKVDFGYEFTVLLENKRKMNLISEENKHAIQARCHAFLVKASEELLARVPRNIATLKQIKNLSPAICLSHTRPPFSELPLSLAEQAKLPEIENQWRTALHTDWHQIFEGDIPQDGSVFWSKSATLKNAGGELIMKDLAEFALKVYSLPISNALVERVFSKVTAVKTKVRNRMG